MRTVSTVLALVLFGPASGAEPVPTFSAFAAFAAPDFAAFSATPAVVVKAAPTDPTQPAPPGMQWQKWGNEPWKLVELVAAPVQEVRQNPFPDPSSIVPTPAQPAGAPSTALAGTTRTGLIRIGVGMTGRRGGTNCTVG